MIGIALAILWLAIGVLLVGGAIYLLIYCCGLVGFEIPPTVIKILAAIILILAAIYLIGIVVGGGGLPLAHFR